MLMCLSLFITILVLLVVVKYLDYKFVSNKLYLSIINYFQSTFCEFIQFEIISITKTQNDFVPTLE